MRKFFAWAIGSALGAGFVPKAPGTAGTVVGIPVAYFTADWAWPARVGLWLFLLAIGTWSAKSIDQLSGTSDNQKIVIDEVVGYGLTSWTVGHGMWGIAVAFLLFRFFDVLKIPPVRQVDRWSKAKAQEKSGEASSWWGGWGVMADDVLAGVQGLLVILVLQKLNVLS